MVAWSPLAGGLLTGKYARAGAGSTAPLDQSLRMESNRKRANERNLAIIEAVAAVAKECGRSPAQVAIRWVLQKPDVASVIIGARTRDQLHDNLAAAAFELGAEQMQRLDDVSHIEAGYPHDYLRSGSVTRFLYGGAKID